MTRREAAEKVFNYIRENKFEPTNIQYGDGYFIFDMGADGVVHFKIKGLHGWKFAMWIETDVEKLKRESDIHAHGDSFRNRPPQRHAGPHTGISDHQHRRSGQSLSSHAGRLR